MKPLELFIALVFTTEVLLSDRSKWVEQLRLSRCRSQPESLWAPKNWGQPSPRKRVCLSLGLEIGRPRIWPPLLRVSRLPSSSQRSQPHMAGNSDRLEKAHPVSF